MKIKKFEDLKCWQESRKLRKMISDVTSKVTVRRDVVFCNQIRSAALSIISNIAEGFESNTDKERMNFLNYARRSCGEVRNDLYAALDDNYIDENNFNEIYDQVCITGKLISGFISYLRNFSRQDKTKQSDCETIRR